ncbi:MAG: SsrA-binding protein [Candidatus Spechtbacteria bacterium RIFCSPLOWO2_02_FULL_38_8]|uniref:SsrA-binding protein n=1 Tax=Candidatus Spechtbacteria bacterium RIFCSPLOWO2_02_FULL_38_8 TaxID=1802164 RepID=A0A1G2HGY9_9BACT|nr:MAG: SsrA-binding protein [Candidatus Spechtbacteria bacterium RIFCSPLOWO2_02_FULL_38_8]
MSKIYSYNKKAKFDYEILDTYDAGIKLFGHEVKSVKKGSVSLQGAFVVIRGQEAYLTNVYIPPYQEGNLVSDYDSKRTRKLLLKKKQILELQQKLQTRGLTLVPLKLYNMRGLIKLDIGLARGKRKYDKREVIKKREADRKIRKSLKNSKS